MKHIKKIICSFFMMMVLVGSMLNVNAAIEFVETDSSENEVSDANPITDLGISTTTSSYLKFNFKSGEGKCVKVLTWNMATDNAVYVTLCDANKNEISDKIKLTSARKYCQFYIRQGGTYYIKTRTSKGSVTLKKRSIPLLRQGGSSFAKATLLSKGATKKDVLGCDSAVGTKHYYKIVVPTEQQVILKIKKGNSANAADSMKISIYRADNLMQIDVGGLFEGQSGGSFYIRNSLNKKTAPGTYYVVVEKFTGANCAFSYSLTW